MRPLHLLIPSLLGVLGLACASAPPATASAGATASASAGAEARCKAYALPNNPDVVPPRLIHGDYPSAHPSTAGTVCVRATITESGSVVDPIVVQTDDREFAAAFVSALTAWRYEPATRGSAKVIYHAAIFARRPGVAASDVTPSSTGR